MIIDHPMPAPIPQAPMTEAARQLNHFNRNLFKILPTKHEAASTEKWQIQVEKNSGGKQRGEDFQELIVGEAADNDESVFCSAAASSRSDLTPHFFDLSTGSRGETLQSRSAFDLCSIYPPAGSSMAPGTALYQADPALPYQHPTFQDMTIPQAPQGSNDQEALN